MQFTYLQECYKHKWLLDFVNQQIDNLSYRVSNVEKLSDRIFNYIGKYLLQSADNYKNRSFIKRLVMKKIKETLSRYAGLDDDQLWGSINEEKGANLIDCCSNQEEERRELNFWIETLAGDNPKDRIIVASFADGNSLQDTARILTEQHGGKLSGNRSSVNRFRTKCINNKQAILNTL